MKRKNLLIALIALMIVSLNALGCTNFLITKGASADGSTLISYAADSHQFYGELYYWPAKEYPEGAMLDIYEWDTGKYLGQIKQARQTYNVVGNMNEYQVAIGETTYGGRSELVDTTGIIDYGSLMYIALQRSKSAREAIKTMTELVEEYGYYSAGESFSISDPDEVWIMEMIGKGPGNTGAVWVARQIPDGYISAHANQARITTFPKSKKNDWFNPKQTTFHSKDVVSFAKKAKFYKGSDEDFSFSDVYAPVDFGGARFCEMRVYAMFKDVSEEIKNNDMYWNYVKGNVKHPKAHVDGEPLTPEHFASNRMPLWIKPDRKISAQDMMAFMRDHLEGTELDMTKDWGAEPFGIPYRWRPLTWEVDGVMYCNERATATQQTAFSFVAEAKSWMPDGLGGTFWFGIDDAANSVYIPIYSGINQIPKSFEKGNGSMIEFTMDAAFWVFNMVSNLAYTRYSYIHPEIAGLQQSFENDFVEQVKNVDLKAKELYEKDKQEAIKYITDYSVGAAEETFRAWKNLYGYLFAKYKDGNIMHSKDMKLLDNGNNKNVPPMPDQPGYSDAWYKELVKKTGDQFKMTGPMGH